MFPLHSYLREKVRHYFACFLGTSIILFVLLYIIISPVYGLYRWQFGFIGTALAGVIGGFVYYHCRLYLYYVQGYKCPACGGLVEMDEISLLGAVKTDDGAVPELIDRISTCTLCGKENHLVYVHSVFYNLDMNADRYTQSVVKRLQRRPESNVARIFGLKKDKPLLPTRQYRFRGPFELFFNGPMETKALLRKLGLGEDQIEQILTSERTLSDLIGEYLPNYEDWYLLVRRLQDVARQYNQADGITLAWPEIMYYVPEGFEPEWLVYGKYEWLDGEYRKLNYAKREDKRKSLD